MTLSISTRDERRFASAARDVAIAPWFL